MPGSTPAAGRRSAAFVGFLVFIELCSGILQEASRCCSRPSAPSSGWAPGT
ncbi:hypothetical protein ACFQXA_37040 [Nocardiopsis composta]